MFVDPETERIWGSNPTTLSSRLTQGWHVTMSTKTPKGMAHQKELSHMSARFALF